MNKKIIYTSIAVIIIIVAAFAAWMYLAPRANSPEAAPGESGSSTSPAASANNATADIEAELNAIDTGNLEADFNEVDKDLQSL